MSHPVVVVAVVATVGSLWGSPPKQVVLALVISAN